METVDSFPPIHRNNKRSNTIDYGDAAYSAAPGCAGMAGVPSLLILIALGASSNWASHTILAGLWPYLMGLFALIVLPCGAIIFWRFYKLKKLQEYEESKRMSEQRLLQEQVKLTRQTSLLVQESRVNGDNVKIQFGDNNTLKSVEIIRASVLLEQSRIQQAGRGVRQVSEVKPAQLAQPRPEKKISGPAIMRETEIIVPHAYDLASVMRRLPESELFLGIDHHDRWLCCDPTDQLCHGALNAVTGRGKTILVRGLETQLLKMGCEVVHADIKFTLIDEYGNDYKPLAKALLQQGELDMGNETYLPHLLLRDDHICNMIMWLAGPELRRRLAMYAQGDHSYGVFYLFLEELAYLLSKYKWLGPLIADLLVVGRSLGIKVVAVAQNFQVQNLKINSGMRENFESAWYLGGDWNSGAAILDMAETELKELIAQHNIQLGKGVSMFRNNAVAYEPVVLRAGMASNDFVYYFLGRADGLLLPAHILPTADSVASDKSPLRGDGKQGQGGYSGRNTPLEMPQNGLETPLGMVVDADGYAQKNGVERPVEQTQGAQGGAMKYRLDDEQVRLFCFIYPDIEKNKDEALKKVGANTAYRAHANELILQYNLMAKKQKSS